MHTSYAQHNVQRTISQSLRPEAISLIIQVSI
uniref:Uncharacterized protein n=1 Tax=Romanomermis culicivorax TaxID=13658 RepID=A0A915JWK7_ROMCU